MYVFLQCFLSLFKPGREPKSKARAAVTICMSKRDDSFTVFSSQSDPRWDPKAQRPNLRLSLVPFHHLMQGH